MFLLLPFIIVQRNFSQGNQEHIERDFEEGDVMLLQALEPLMSVYFITSNGFTVNLLVDGMTYNTFDGSHLRFVDFGASVGGLKFTAKSKTKLSVDVFVFPNECNPARIITNKISYTFMLTKNSKDPFFEIKNDQIFCIWHVSQGPKNVSVIVNSVDVQDTFKQMQKNTDILTLNGKVKKVVSYNRSDYWFKWRSDPDYLSEYISASFTSDVPQRSNDLYFLSSLENLTKISYVNIESELVDPAKGASGNSKMYTTIWIVASVIVIFAILIVSMICLFKKCASAKIEATYSTQDAQELLDDFTLCSTSSMLPQPVSFND